jgi:hypothetical protein
MNSAKILIAKLDRYQLGVQHGKTMAEVDAYYEGLLKEIEELQKLLVVSGPLSIATDKKQRATNVDQREAIKNGQESREEINPRG